ncbi:hypothetical protein LTR85_008360 [Meristemomyces frigidus]|nr:hypothetical protein LTR85_008360 [Meristemomyces frigidus]
MDTTAFEGGGSGDLPLTKLYQSLPPVPNAVRGPTFIIVSIGGHYLRLAILIIALAGCVAAYCMAILWICLFWTQTKLLIVTAALLRSYLELPPTIANTTGLSAVRLSLEKVHASKANEEKDVLLARIAQRERDVAAQIATAPQEDVDTVKYDDRSTQLEGAQPEVSVATHQALEAPSPHEHHPDEDTSLIELQRETEPDVSISQQQEPISDHVDHGSEIEALPPAASEAQQHSPPPAAARQATRKSGAETKRTVSKEEKKAQAQTAWLSSMSSGTSAVRSTAANANSDTTPARTTGFSAEQIAEAASFMKGATRGGEKQNSKPHGSMRASRPPAVATFKPKHDAPRPQSVSQVAKPSPVKENGRPDSATTLPPHLRKAKEARESRTSKEDVQKENRPLLGSAEKKEIPKPSAPSAESANILGGRGQEQDALTSTAGRSNHVVFAPPPESAGSHATQRQSEPVHSSADEDAARTTEIPAPVRMESAEAQRSDRPASDSTNDECNAAKSVQKGVYDLDTLKSLGATSTSTFGADVVRAQHVITSNSPKTTLVAKKAVPMLGRQARLKVQAPANVSHTSGETASSAASSVPQESAATNCSPQHTAAVEKAVEILNEQAHRKRESLSDLKQTLNEATSPAGPGIMQDPAILYASSEPTTAHEKPVLVVAVQSPAEEDSVNLTHETDDTLFSVADSALQGPTHVSNSYAHSDLLDLDFTPPPTSKALTPTPGRREPSLAPTAPAFFVPSPNIVSSSATPHEDAHEYAISEEADDDVATFEIGSHQPTFSAQQLTYLNAPYQGSRGGLNPSYGQHPPTSPYAYPNPSLQGQYGYQVPSYGPQQAPVQSSSHQAQFGYSVPIYGPQQVAIQSPSHQGQFGYPVPYGSRQAPAQYPYPQPQQQQLHPAVVDAQSQNPRHPAEALLAYTGAYDNRNSSLEDRSRREPPRSILSELGQPVDFRSNGMNTAEGIYDHRTSSGQKYAGTTTASKAVSIVRPPSPTVPDYRCEESFPSLQSHGKAPDTVAPPPGFGRSKPKPKHQEVFDQLLKDTAPHDITTAHPHGPSLASVSAHEPEKPTLEQPEGSGVSDVIAEASNGHIERSEGSASDEQSVLDDDGVHETVDQDSSASNLWGLLGEQGTCGNDERLSSVSSPSERPHPVSNDSTPTNAKKVLKEKKRTARNALLAAWYEREAARKRVKGTFSLEGMKALEAATLAYNYKRMELQQWMGNGVMSGQDAECFPVLSVNDLATQKHRPIGAEEAYIEQRAAEEASMATKKAAMAAEATGNDEEPGCSSEHNSLHASLSVALDHYDDAIAFFKRPPPQGRKDVRTLQAEGKARAERARRNYVGKRDALEKKLPQDPCLVGVFPPDPWAGFKVPEIEVPRQRLWR